MSQFPPEQPPQSPGGWQQPNSGYQQSGQYPPNQSGQPQWQGQPPQPEWQGQSPQSSQPQWQGQSSQSPQPEWQHSNTGYQQPGQYPQQPMQPGMYPPQLPPKKKSRLGLWIAIVVIVVVLAVCGGIVAAVTNGAKSVATVVATQVATTSSSQSQATTAPTGQHFKVGQVVKVNDTWQVTINSIKTSNGDQFLTPSAGNNYFIVDVTLKNLSGQEQTISSALNFSLQDATGQKYTETILTGETPPDGKIEANSLLRGQLTYEVPTSQKSFTFNFEPDIIGGGQTVWDVQK